MRNQSIARRLFGGVGIGIALLALLMTASRAAAQESAAVAPFIDDATIGVIKIDMTAVNPEAAGPFVLELMRAMKIPQTEIDRANADMQKALPQAQKWVADFRKAGGKTVFGVITMSGEPLGFAVIPLEPGADTNKMIELLRDPMGAAPRRYVYEDAKPGQAPPPPKQVNMMESFQGEKIGNVLVFTHPDVMTKVVKNITPAARPELEKALAVAGPSAVKAALIPPEGLRAMLTLQQPKLPAELGGGPTSLLTQGIRWAGAGVDSPPKGAIRLTIQAKDAEAAQKLVNLIPTVWKSAKEHDKDIASMPELDELVSAATPKVTGDQLTLSVDQPKMMDLAGKMAPVAARSRDRALQVHSASNLRQIALGVHMYANEKNALPKDLQELKPYLGGDEGMAHILNNPQRPERKPAYIYVRPADKMNEIKNAVETVIAYESFDKWDRGINVAFADGHVEFIANEAQFQKYLKGGAAPKP